MAGKHRKALSEAYSSTYKVRHLAEAGVDQAFPLVREIAGSLSLADWRRHAAMLIWTGRERPPDSGIVVVQRHNSNYIRGLCAYRLCPDLAVSFRLIVGCFAVPEAVDCASVARALIAACGSIAEAHDCRAVQVLLVEPNSWVAPLLHKAGYCVDQGSFVRLLLSHGSP